MVIIVHEANKEKSCFRLLESIFSKVIFFFYLNQ